MGRVAGVILAAGASRRLGQPKQLLPLRGQPVLAHTVGVARRTRLDPLMIILGHAANEIRRQVDLTNLTVIENPDYAEGLSTSVRLALRHLPGDVEAVVFLLGDQPLVEPAVVDRLIAAFCECRAPIVQPRYAEGRGNPVLIARALFPELDRLTGDTGARPLLERYGGEVHLVDVRAHRRPADLDTWEDYERLRAEFERASRGDIGR
uniref:Nucleotidyltransferase family protein n=1 Tax=Thermorudis peleae TaxID=1382356 RepID=A0A831TAV8_9BACT